MNPTIERVVAEHIDNTEHDLKTALASVDRLREELAETRDSISTLQRNVEEKRRELHLAQWEAKRLQKLADSLRRERDDLLVSWPPRRERGELPATESTPTAGGDA